MTREFTPEVVAFPWKIPSFEILKPLGKGGMGEVYLARQQALGWLVAIKVMSNLTCTQSASRDHILRSCFTSGFRVCLSVDPSSRADKPTSGEAD